MHRARLFSCSFLTAFMLVFSCAEMSGGSTLRGGWAEVSIPSIDGFKISFADSLHGWIVSQNGDIIYTSDAGETWQPRHCPAEILDADLVSDHVGWVRPSGSIGGDTMVYRSTDTGLSWTELRSPVPIYSGAQQVSFISDSIAYVGLNSLWATADAGLTWSERGSLTSVALPNIGFFNANVGYAGNALAGTIPGPTLVKTTDGGLSWLTIEYYPPDYIGGFGEFRFFNGKLGSYEKTIESEIGWRSATLSMTWNHGDSWIHIWNQPATYMIGMTPDSLHQWLLRYTGSIQRTTDGGATWQDDTLAVPIADILYDLHGHQFALGMGRLFRYDSTLTDVVDRPATVKEFALFQNFPNPFNPTTTISFTIPHPSPVILKVYDILGREVATLVNGQMSPGRYERTFDASALASGVYIYRLQAGTFVQTRKLMVVK